MARGKHPELNLGLDSSGGRQSGLMFIGSGGTRLSPAQAEFNKLLGRLETARGKLDRKRRRLDKTLATINEKLLPIVATLNRANRDLVHAAVGTVDGLKLSRRRREALEDLIGGKALHLLADPLGLDDDDITRLQEIADRLVPEDEEDSRAAIDEEFDLLRGILEADAQRHGVDLDLDGLDIHGDPDDFERQLRERIRAAGATFDPEAAGRRHRKPTKAQRDRELRHEQIQAAKQRDIKTLFKQLAKALHPDIEPDPQLKQQRESWMKRLNAAFARKDLREMLEIEMEWLGEERSHLAKAGEEKLRIYCLVLKEQIAELRSQTDMLAYEPQYAALTRFGDPASFRQRDIPYIRAELQNEAARHQQMLAILEAGNAASRRMLNKWADEHLEAMNDPFPFF